jgi:putative transposase
MRIWDAFGLWPHRREARKSSEDPLFVDGIKGVVGLYLVSPQRAVALCADEESRSIDEEQPVAGVRLRRR